MMYLFRIGLICREITNILVKIDEKALQKLQFYIFYKKDSLKAKITNILVKIGFIKSFMKIL